MRCSWITHGIRDIRPALTVAVLSVVAILLASCMVGAATRLALIGFRFGFGIEKP